jgi:hypothetical protein
MLEYRLEHIFTFTATLQNEVIGAVPEGRRVNAYVTGGEVTGPKVTGKLRPAGGDWLTIRGDGVGIVDVRATIETNDGALIYVIYQGVLDGGKLRVAPRFQTAHPDYQWLNRLQCLGIGQASGERNEVSYDVYAVY